MRPMTNRGSARAGREAPAGRGVAGDPGAFMLSSPCALQLGLRYCCEAVGSTRNWVHSSTPLEPGKQETFDNVEVTPRRGAKRTVCARDMNPMQQEERT